ncbi:MAG: FadR/GntR family transcriptional regulator [Candidatus Devosia phytovorans]|uniref:FadR/GntR family transcriptional regulator n=1 Tax=Candidatus Devosia phytovorans TaxID=3121372 RepID=A0AAJ6B029_9HYPH|nr:FadR/GntR family transcriptional regulator [Devosia sp.]WEK04416.1 MAG: FadR/GntR family transcriptional regulator [Devosia sp.]
MATRHEQDNSRGDLIASIAGRVPSRNLHSLVLGQLGAAIVRGDYAEGAILPSDTELLARFSVSRTVLREALKTLAAKGMIEARARIGTRVLPRQRWNLFDADVLAWHFEAGPDVDFLRSVAEVRIGIELESAALAAERRTQAQADHLVALADAMGEATTAEEFARADLAFHRAVAEAASNPFMASISALVEVALTAVFTISSPVANKAKLEETAANHGAIAEAIRAQNVEAARDTMRAVISDGFARSAERLERAGA